MPSAVSEIVNAQYAPNAQTTIYTSPAGTTTRIDKLTVTNQDSSVHTISINLVTSGDVAGTENRTTNAQAILAGTTWNSPNEYGHYLNPGDFISVIADAASVLTIAVGATQVVTA